MPRAAWSPFGHSAVLAEEAPPKAQSAGSSSSSAVLAEDSLASHCEAEKIRELRRLMVMELSELTARGHDFPHTTGDIFLLRVLRGHDGDVERACAWYRKCLAVRQARRLDELHLQLEAAQVPLSFGRMPHATEVAAYTTMVFDEQRWRTPRGDLLFYDALGDLQSRGMVRDLGWDRCREFLTAMLERRLAVLDRMSREQNRMVKIVRVFDCEGTGLWSYDPSFVDKVHRDIDPVSYGTQVEVIHANYIINTPWFGARIYGLLRERLPVKMQRVVRLLGRDFLEDATIADLGTDSIKRLTETWGPGSAARRSELELKREDSTPLLRAARA